MSKENEKVEKFEKVEKKAHDGKKHLTIAMQGGGAHGAFTWGVLDRLFEESDIVVEGVSGASAGGMNEITNNTSIMREMRSMHFIRELMDKKIIEPGTMKKMNIHLIEDEEVFQDLGWSSKLNTDEEFLKHLFDAGRVAADKWMAKNYDKIGKETTASIVEEFV